MYLNKVLISGVNTSELQVLSSDEMTELFKRLEEGDKSVRNTLASGNLKLVLSILKRFQNKGNMDDLFQVGCIGLMKAIDNFDLSHNVKFSTYAVPMILGEVKRYLRDNSSIRISRSIKDLAYKILRLQEEYFNKTGKVITPSEIAEILGEDIYDVSMAISSLKEPVSIFKSIYNDGGDTIYLYDQIEDKKGITDFSNQLAIENAIDDLDSREKYILDERFVIGKSQMEIANELDISQAQVSRLEKKAINQLKKVLK